jgi:hypothetical protein
MNSGLDTKLVWFELLACSIPIIGLITTSARLSEWIEQLYWCNFSGVKSKKCE